MFNRFPGYTNSGRIERRFLNNTDGARSEQLTLEIYVIKDKVVQQNLSQRPLHDRLTLFLNCKDFGSLAFIFEINLFNLDIWTHTRIHLCRGI